MTPTPFNLFKAAFAITAGVGLGVFICLMLITLTGFIRVLLDELKRKMKK